MSDMESLTLVGPILSGYTSAQSLKTPVSPLEQDIEFGHRLGWVRTSYSNLRLWMGLTSEIALHPGDFVLVIEKSDYMTETTVLLDADEMV
jgi:hypothetical protein